MSQPPRYYGNNDLHYLTTSTYRRTPVFNSERFKREFVATLAELRIELGFRLLGYVLMPEHFHLLVWPSDGANPSQIMQRLKGRTARSILKTLRQERRYPWCARMLARLSLPATVHDEANCRVWQRRFYDMNIWTEKKQLEKLDYMHNNPVVRKLVGTQTRQTTYLRHPPTPQFSASWRLDSTISIGAGSELGANVELAKGGRTAITVGAGEGIKGVSTSLLPVFIISGSIPYCW